MAVTYYESEDIGAPQYTTGGSTGAYTTNIIEIMDAILINGYGAKPGLGWTKEMTSEVEGSDRTVYKNQSAHQDDMFLLVESNQKYNYGVRMQIADSVTSPEVYSGYSQIACFYRYTSYGQFKWKAVGDERTVILLFWHDKMYTQSNGSFDNFAPLGIYIGDFESFNDDNPKCWGLLAPGMYTGSLNTLAINAGTYNKAFYNSFSQLPSYKNYRPVTQVPEEEWSEDDCYFYLSSALCTGERTSSLHPYIRSISEFEQRAQLKTPWYAVVGMRHFYQLRGVYNILPWLNHSDENNRANMLKPLMIDGISYLATKQDNYDYTYNGMSFYIQTSGDW